MSGKKGDEPPGLPPFEEFAAALRVEYEEKLASERKKLEDHLADLISRRRREVEQEAARMRAVQARELDERTGAMRRRLAGEIRARIGALGSDVLEIVERIVAERICSLSKDASQRMTRRLAEEAVRTMGERCVAIVRPECGDMEFPENVEVIEASLEDHWGGCVVTDASTRRRFVDNSLRKRWERCRGRLLAELGRELTPVLEEAERLIGELRLS